MLFVLCQIRDFSLTTPPTYMIWKLDMRVYYDYVYCVRDNQPPSDCYIYVCVSHFVLLKPILQTGNMKHTYILWPKYVIHNF